VTPQRTSSPGAERCREEKRDNPSRNSSTSALSSISSCRKALGNSDAVDSLATVWCRSCMPRRTKIHLTTRGIHGLLLDRTENYNHTSRCLFSPGFPVFDGVVSGAQGRTVVSFCQPYPRGQNASTMEQWTGRIRPRRPQTASTPTTGDEPSASQCSIWWHRHGKPAKR
jgi:hypothetical protein